MIDDSNGIGDVLAMRLAEAEQLIRWLAIPWGPNDPLFPDEDPHSHQLLPENVRNRHTWFRVIRGAEPTPFVWGADSAALAAVDTRAGGNSPGSDQQERE